MAIKKRRYGSLPATHRVRAGSNLVAARRSAAIVRSALSKGNCGRALSYFKDVAALTSAYRTEARSLPGPSKGFILHDTVEKLERAIAKKCFR